MEAVLDAIRAAAGGQGAGPGEWARRGACREADPELFYAHRCADEAKAVCAGCPVRQECLAYALALPEKEGVWGGLDANDRLLLRDAGTERECGRCGCSKPVTEFSPDGRGGWLENCRPCRAKAESEGRKRRRENRNGTAGDPGGSAEEKGTGQ
jgi:WhiB family redox-sensing transcriptional regulator